MVLKPSTFLDPPHVLTLLCQTRQGKNGRKPIGQSMRPHYLNLANSPKVPVFDTPVNTKTPKFPFLPSPSPPAYLILPIRPIDVNPLPVKLTADSMRLEKWRHLGRARPHPAHVHRAGRAGHGPNAREIRRFAVVSYDGNILQGKHLHQQRLRDGLLKYYYYPGPSETEACPRRQRDFYVNPFHSTT